MRKPILIIEDDATVALALERRLWARGYAPRVCAEPEAAIAAFDALGPELVILSLTLSDADGRELCQRLRARPLGGLVPIVFLGTGAQEVRTVAESIAAGADHFVRKPDGLELLLAKITSFIGAGDASEVGTPEPEWARVAGAAGGGAPLADAPIQSTRRGETPRAQPDTPGLAAPSQVRAALSRVLGRTFVPGRVPVTVVSTGSSLGTETGSDTGDQTGDQMGSDTVADSGADARAPDREESISPEASWEATTSDDLASAWPALAPSPLEQETSPSLAVDPVAASALSPGTTGSTTRTETAPIGELLTESAQPLPRETTRPGLPGPWRLPDDGPMSEPDDPTETLVSVAEPARWSPETHPPPPLSGDRPGRGFAPPQSPAAPPDSATARWEAVLDVGRSVPIERRALVDVLVAAERARLTGRVEVAAGGVLRRVFWDEGRPVYADSSSTTEDLASALAADGRVARSVLVEVRARAESTGASTEEVLIEAGLLAPDDIYGALRAHVIERLVSLAGLESGEALVFRGGPRPPDPVELNVPVGRLVLDGVRRKYGRLRLYRAFGTGSATPRPLSARPTEGPPLRPEETLVLRACDGHRTVVEIARAARLGELEALAILHGLATIDLIERPGGRVLGALPALDAERVAVAAAPRTADELPGFSELVEVKLGEVRSADYFQVLQVPRGATSAEVQLAWETLRRRFDPHRVRRESPLWGQVQEIVCVLDDAKAIIGHPGRRERYERALS